MKLIWMIIGGLILMMIPAYIFYPEASSFMSDVRQKYLSLPFLKAQGSTPSDQTITISDQFRYTGEYELKSITGNESIMFDVEIKDQEICLISKIGESKEIDKIVYTIPDNIKLIKNDIKEAETYIDKRITSDISKETRYDYCYTANPETDFYLKFGEDSVVVSQVLQIVAKLDNIQAEVNYTHMMTGESGIFSSMVLYMPFDDNESLSVDYDWTNYNNDVSTTTGTPIYLTDGGVYKGYKYFDGDGDYMRVPMSDSLNITKTNGNFAVSFWAKTGHTSGTAVSSGGSDPRNFQFYITSNKITFYMRDNDSIIVAVDSVSDINDDEWHHILAVRDVTEDKVLMYFDGNNEANTTDTTTGNLFEGDVNGLVIGDRYASGDYVWNGSIDEVMIFNNVVTPASVNNIYSNISSRYARYTTTSSQANKWLNISTGDNRVNFTCSGCDFYKGTSIGGAVGYWNYTDGYNDTDDSLVLSYHLDNNSEYGESDTLAYDFSEKSSTGIIVGMNVSDSVMHQGFYNIGNISGAGGYETSDAKFINASHNPAFSFDNITDRTYSFWIRGLSASQRAGYVIKKDTNFYSFCDPTWCVYRLEEGANLGNLVISSSLVLDDTWHKIDVVIDRHGVPYANLTVYLDGFYNGADADISNVGNTSGTGDLYIGGVPNSPWYNFNGSIDEVKIYNRTLSQAEILENYVLGHMNYSYTTFQNASIENEHIINNETSILLPMFNMTAGSGSYQFYSPILYSAQLSTGLDEVPEDDEYPLFSNFDSSPADNSQYGLGTEYEFNSTITNTNDTLGLEFNGVNYSASEEVADIFNVSYLVSDLSGGTYYYYWWGYGNGSNNNFNMTSSQTYIVAVNTTSKAHCWINGTEGDYTALNNSDTSMNIWLNATLTNAVGSISLGYNGSKWNEGKGMLSNMTNLSVTDGNEDSVYNVSARFTANSNYSVNQTYCMVNITIPDIIPPAITITYPTNNSNHSNTGIEINYTYVETNCDSAWWSEDVGTTNNSLASCGTNITGETWTEGTNEVTIYMNDSMNNEGNADITFTIDITAPTFDNLQNHTVIANASFSFDLDASDSLGVDSFLFNTSTHFVIDIATGIITNATLLSDIDIYYLNVSVNDTIDNLASAVFWINITEEIKEEFTFISLIPNVMKIPYVYFNNLDYFVKKVPYVHLNKSIDFT